MSPFLSSTKSASMSKAGLGSYLDQFAATLKADFRFAPLNALLLISIFVVGLVVHLWRYAFSAEAVVLFLGSALALAVILRLSQVWETAAGRTDWKRNTHNHAGHATPGYIARSFHQES